jgi:hypothetical protein
MAAAYLDCRGFAQACAKLPNDQRNKQTTMFYFSLYL